MRGRPDCPKRMTQTGRNTPAYAGKTRTQRLRLTCSWKHPRVCGEDSAVVKRSFCPTETPPRMRGRLSLFSSGSLSMGNTPAYAGKTRRQNRWSAPRWKHPRVCGEDHFGEIVRHHLLETPPRMRGRLTNNTPNIALCRNTPAYAGKTSFCTFLKLSTEKHPRVCGEDKRFRQKCPMLPETPPRMRGRLRCNRC